MTSSMPPPPGGVSSSGAFSGTASMGNMGGGSGSSMGSMGYGGSSPSGMPGMVPPGTWRAVPPDQLPTGPEISKIHVGDPFRTLLWLRVDPWFLASSL